MYKSTKTIYVALLVCLVAFNPTLADEFLERSLQDTTLKPAQLFPVVTNENTFIKPLATNVEIEMAFEQTNTTPAGANKKDVVLTAPVGYVFDSNCKPAAQPTIQVGQPQPTLGVKKCSPWANTQFASCMKGTSDNMLKITLLNEIATDTSSCQWFSFTVAKVPAVMSTKDAEKKFHIQYADHGSEMLDANMLRRITGWGDIKKPSSGAIGSISATDAVMRPNKVKSGTRNAMAVYFKTTTTIADNNVILIKFPSGYELTTKKECSDNDLKVAVKTCVKKTVSASTCTDRDVGKIANNVVESGKVFGCSVKNSTTLMLQKGTASAAGAIMVKVMVKAPTSPKKKSGMVSIYTCTGACDVPSAATYLSDAKYVDIGKTLDDVEVQKNAAGGIFGGISLMILAVVLV
eukprot:Platyproteum_vivax@DN4451_c0_g1_i1.p1